MSEKKKVLVIDDEPDLSAMVKKNLEKEGFDVDIAYNGQEGIEKIQESPPDIVVLDVMMPEKDGFAVCKELKSNDEYADIPIIMLTAVAEHVSSTRYSHYGGMSMEADDYLPKPSSAEEITESVKRLLED